MQRKDTRGCHTMSCCNSRVNKVSEWHRIGSDSLFLGREESKSSFIKEVAFELALKG